MSNKKRLCDYCNESEALLYCRADSAKLCLSCDKEVHATNQLFTKHYRSQLCDACGSAPASFFCETEQQVLCQNCDWEIHSYSESSIHSRRTIEGFTGCPSVFELISIVGLDDLDNKALSLSENGVSTTRDEDDYGISDFLMWETPQVVSLNDLVVSSESGHHYRATEVPPLPKNRNEACGRHKEEMLRQIGLLAKAELNSTMWQIFDPATTELEAGTKFHSLKPQQDIPSGNEFADEELDMNFPPLSNEETGLQWLNESGEPAVEDFLPLSSMGGLEEDSCREVLARPDTIGDGNQVRGSPHLPLKTYALSGASEVHRHEINTQGRETAISRYKEKKKLRRYDKHIRYESRKLRAENRTRIKGRFAKADQ